MRRLALLTALGLALSLQALPQETAPPGEASQAGEQHDPWIWWKWLNFAILAGGLGYLIAKHTPALFRRRAQEIEQAIAQAAAAKKDAEAQAAGLELRLAGLKTEIDNLRIAARADIQTEGERIARETEQRLQRIREQSGQEIELMSRAVRLQLHRYSAELALDLAQQRIRPLVTSDVQNGLVDGFLQGLRGSR